MIDREKNTVESSLIEPNSDGCLDTIETSLFYPLDSSTQLDTTVYGR